MWLICVRSLPFCHFCAEKLLFTLLQMTFYHPANANGHNVFKMLQAQCPNLAREAFPKSRKMIMQVILRAHQTLSPCLCSFRPQHPHYCPFALTYQVLIKLNVPLLKYNGDRAHAKLKDAQLVALLHACARRPCLSSKSFTVPTSVAPIATKSTFPSIFVSMQTALLELLDNISFGGSYV